MIVPANDPVASQNSSPFLLGYLFRLREL